MPEPKKKAEEVGDFHDSYKTASMFVENTYISKHERIVGTRGSSCGLQIYSSGRSGPLRH